VPVWDADATVHRLYGPDGAAVAPLARLCPAALKDGAIDRAALKDWIAADPAALKAIEAVVHPLVAADRADFVARHRAAGTPLVVVDIPLLFETGAEAALRRHAHRFRPAEVQRARVLARPGMTEETFQTLLAKQMPDAEKRKRATHVIETTGLEQTRAAVEALIAELTKG
jgi:dephospho-CoA kinase